ncbi:c-type cytochrome [Sphingomonas sp.]|uniref:c-type cytochrome n=1 Tax=Sphingomonas sp. TaxID=28214 RepID=UPI001B2E853E|nr:c-type cytochrome [Sphingomonas sp.]MBO9715098.1 c-type cytochrome [Sphingomonas sp.]
MTRPPFFLAAVAIAVPTALLAAPRTPMQAAATPPPAFAQCKACHTVTKGGATMVGPNLFGVVGSAAGSKPGYAYSPGMKAANLKWSRATLDTYLADPKKAVPGTRMAIPGVTEAEKRKAIIDYLATLK